MEFDLSDQPEIVQQAFGYAEQGFELAMRWAMTRSSAQVLITFLSAAAATTSLKVMTEMTPSMEVMDLTPLMVASGTTSLITVSTIFSDRSRKSPCMRGIR